MNPESSNKHQESSLPFEVFDISSMGVVAGMMDQINLTQITDKLIPKIGQHDVTHGQALKFMVLRFLSTEAPKGFCHFSSFAKKIPVAALLGVDHNLDLDPSKFNQYVCGRLLDEIYEYGAAEFSMEFFHQALTALGDTSFIESVHVDSTSRGYHMAPYSEDQCLMLQKDRRVQKIASNPNKLAIDQNPPAPKRGYPRGVDPKNPQLNIIHAVTTPTETMPSVPILSFTYSGNENDVKSFSQVSEQCFPRLKGFYDGLRYVIFDSAGASFRNVYSLKKIGLNVITRIPDNRVRSAINQAKSGCLKFETFEINGKTCNGAWVETPHIFSGLVDKSNRVLDEEEASKLPEDAVSKVDVQARLLVVQSEALRKTKTETITKRAKHEKNRLNKAKAQMNKQPFSCYPDAEAAVKKLTDDPRYCNVSNITYEEKKCYGKVGAPSANAEYTLEIRPKFDVELDQEKIESAINSELFYVLAVTDCKRDWSAQELVDIYHKQSHVERTWRDIKATEFFVNAFLVKNPCRARALLTVVSIALFVLKLVLQRIHAFMRESKLRFPVGQSQSSERPTWQTITGFFDEVEHRLYLLKYNGEALVAPTMSHSFIPRLLEFMGEAFSKYYDARTYQDYAVNMVLQRKDLAVSRKAN